jgi:DNA-binding MarR family transcriptional regulator
MAHRPDAGRLEAWRLMLETHASTLDLLGPELEAECGLPLTWYDVLLQLSEAHEHRLRMSDLAECVLLSRSGLSRLVDRMVDAGLIERARCPSDRRGAYAVLTPSGLGKLREAAPVHLRGIEKHFGRHIDDAEARAMTGSFKKVLAAAGGPRGARGCGEAEEAAAAAGNGAAANQ